jgi:hypothetical protein
VLNVEDKKALLKEEEDERLPVVENREMKPKDEEFKEGDLCFLFFIYNFRQLFKTMFCRPCFELCGSVGLSLTFFLDVFFSGMMSDSYNPVMASKHRLHH